MRNGFLELVEDFICEFLEYFQGQLVFEHNLFRSKMKTNMSFEEHKGFLI